MKRPGKTRVPKSADSYYWPLKMTIVAVSILLLRAGVSPASHPVPITPAFPLTAICQGVASQNDAEVTLPRPESSKPVYSTEALAGQQFAHEDLSDTIWKGADLRGARFIDCILDRADFSEAYMGGVAFERCRMRETRFRSTSLRGAYLNKCDLSGVDFTNADIAGMTLIDITLCPSGATHLAALRAAVELRGGSTYSLAFLAAISGDAFAFTYDRSNRAGWPGQPITVAPVLRALESLGFHVTYRMNLKNIGTARRELTATLRRGLVAILPMRLAGGGLDGNTVEQPVWVVVHELMPGGEDNAQVSIQTPFGPMMFDLEDFLRRWRGAWPTLMPKGESLDKASFPIYSVGALRTQVTELSAISRALATASAIMTEPRTFANTYGGFQAYQALVEDARNEALMLGELVHWSGAPRLALAGSRQLAAEFLTEAAVEVPETARQPLIEAAGLYAEVATLLTDEWPFPSPAAFESEETTTAIHTALARRPHVAALLEAVLSREQRALALLEEAAGNLEAPMSPSEPNP
ncbi:MAG: pentapeptide repeat-containing protein [Candidatus Zipacnadales bacterium]